MRKYVGINSDTALNTVIKTMETLFATVYSQQKSDQEKQR